MRFTLTMRPLNLLYLSTVSAIIETQSARSLLSRLPLNQSKGVQDPHTRIVAIRTKQVLGRTKDHAEAILVFGMTLAVATFRV